MIQQPRNRDLARSERLTHGLFPAILNLATNAEISANATCGEKGPEMSCKLVEHVPGRRVRNAQCRLCDANSANPKERHPISNAIDGTNNWWQSPSIQNGRVYHWVTITLDLRQVFQVAYIIIKAANAPRPGNWILERSLDGVTFSPWQYYAVSDSECLTRYNITPRRGPPTYRADDEVICTSYYSRLVPLEHGEIHTSLVNGRPSADDLSPRLLEFTSARYIRLRLQRIRTLNADLMTLSHLDPRDIDPIVTRRYYYSIKDISVGGMCICHGHASSCPWDDTTKRLRCQCEHNTCGISCDRCCPGFHQQPWRPGTVSSGNSCEECNCHHKAKDCYYDQDVANQKRSLNTAGQFRGGGVCIGCQQNTMGINCEACVDGYYRPHKVSPYEDEPCRPCDCDQLGSLSSVCIKDDLQSNSHNGLWPGQCPCKEGYAGERCDRCQFGYRGFPSCVRCNCSPAGSVNDDPCAEPCLCKDNVEGEACDHCKPGFYNLQEKDPQGCSECFCFGLSSVCDSLSWPLGQVNDMSGWMVTDLAGARELKSQQEAAGGRQISISHAEVAHSLGTRYYWSAPEAYLGNKLTAFGGFLRYTVSYDIPTETADGDLLSDADVILRGNGLTLSTQAEGLSLQPYEEYHSAVRLVPENFLDHTTKREIDRDQLMTVLVNLSHLLIRANYNTAKTVLYRLDSVSLDIASPNAIDLTVATDVEHCECPQGYMGTSCESCQPGYYRVDGILFGGICQPCECHGHAWECDAHGVCLGCTHNTTGDHCEQCLPGFYGTPSQGTAGDCRRCACPLTTPSNNFSPICHLDEEEDVVCDQCAPGYAGTWCERCADGYYGNPTIPGGSCLPCDCSGNVDPSEPGHCDSVTGECLKCVGNTDGAHCESCADGFYGDAVTAKDCRACDCHEKGSLSSMCHRETGHCDCRPHVTGQRCDQCLPGHYGLDAGLGCLPCNCSTAGSTSDACTDQGHCHCVPGVAGRRCDRCSHGFYAYRDGGCTPCDCAHTQDSCDPESGECVCPPHTQGPKCEECAAQHWGWDAERGCQACNCSRPGSTGPQCDLLSGQCPCKAEFGGQSCGQCSLGYRDFPDCVPCDCDLRGTLAASCALDRGVCSCTEDSGACSCKENVSGLRCSQCRPGTFALRAQDPRGCTPCFCFGLSHLCGELQGYVRTAVTLGAPQPLLRVVSQSNLTGTTEGVYHQDPDILLDAAALRHQVPTEPLYWRLPEQFQGDQLLAYGGRLRYSVAFYASHGTGTFNLEPQVLIRGGRSRKQVIYVDATVLENGVRHDQEVGMKEDFWKYFNSVSEEPVTREDFMSVLSNIEYILVKASYGQGLQQSRISNISMEVGTEAGGRQLTGTVASLIEHCVCPPGTAGFSCQDCAPGFRRQKLPEGGRESWPLLAPCMPCSCSNHSDTCDPETGKCLDCRDNTAGHHCELCAPGYYGKVTGTAHDCSLCTCPHRHPASFSPTCVLEGDGGFRCNACVLGHEGRYCERCSLGYYGNPGQLGGSCRKCDCSPQGSVHSDCDLLSGQCTCRPGATGLRCDGCQLRHLLVDSSCVSCDDECVGVLLDGLDRVGDAMLSVNLTGIFPAPYGVLSNLENATKYLRESLIKENTQKNSVEVQLEDVAKQTNDLQSELTGVLTRSQQVGRAAEGSLQQSRDLAAFVERLQMDISETLEKATNLNQTLDEDFQLPNSTLQSMQHSIASLLEMMQKRLFTHLLRNATLELKAAEDVLSAVQKNFQLPQEEQEVLKEAARHLLSKHIGELQAAGELLRRAEAQTQESAHLLLLSEANLQSFSNKKLHIQEQLNVTSELVAEGRRLMDLATAQAGSLQTTLAQGERHRDKLLMWTAELRSHVDGLVMQMSQRSVVDRVYRAEGHAAELQRSAGVLDSGLENVRHVSLNATSAVHVHSNIQSLTGQSESLATDAREMARRTQLSSVSLISKGKEAVQRTSGLLAGSSSLSGKQRGLTRKLSELQSTASRVRESAGRLAWQTSESLSILRVVPEGAGDRAARTKELAESADRSAAGAVQKAQGLSQKLLDTSAGLARVNATVQETRGLLRDSAVTTLLAGKKVKDAETHASLLFEQLKPLRTLEENLSRNLSEIKLLISQARKQAASIRVAVAADRDCVRAYQPQISSTNYNTLTLNVRSQEPDNLLFYLGSSGGADFLAVETRRGKVAFLWDLGSGSARLEFPDLRIDENRWYSIHATRFGNIGSLSVKDMSSTQGPRAKMGRSPGVMTVLDVNNSTLVFVGGLGGQIKKSPAVKVTHFKGCMGEAYLNGRSIGLWNYKEREGRCRGCFGSPQNEDSSFHFDGSGYSVVEKATRATVTQVVMLFNTFSPNGLLLYLTSNGTKDFLSVELVHGRVRVMVDLGSGPLTLTTDRRYNNGSWYKIAFQRNRKQGLLAVIDVYNTSDKETKQGESPGASSDLNRLDKDPIYVGGLPWSRIPRKGVTSKSYVGCIKNLEISRSTFDLLRNSYGVGKGCVLEPIRSVSFLRGGHVELPPRPLSPDSRLLATFATKNSSGLILAAISRDAEKQGRRPTDVPFFAIMLIDGHVEVHVSLGDRTSLRKALVHAPSGSYGDGQEHSVSVVRTQRTVTVQLDEAKPVEMRLGPAAEGRTIGTSTLYVGGVPEEAQTSVLKSSFFSGCIKNLIFNMELLDFTRAMASEHVDLDSCLLSERPEPVPGVEDEELLSQPQAVPRPGRCAVDTAPQFVSGAHQFGLLQNSHLVLPFNHTEVRKRLLVQLSIRTFTSSGLVFYTAHQNQVDHATLQLYGGRLAFFFDLGKGRTHISHPTLINDGKWHTVKAEYFKRKGSVTVDGHESPMVTTVGDGTSLDVEGKLYLGGLPPNYRARNIGNVTHSIAACIGEVTVNSKPLDTDSPASALAVDRCYTAAEEGTFFEGSGYAALVREGYRVRSDLNISFEFRTSSENGVLLGISSAKVDALGLEIVSGQVGTISMGPLPRDRQFTISVPMVILPGRAGVCAERVFILPTSPPSVSGFPLLAYLFDGWV
ncbi:laminin subunit alpha-1 isoform X1 [Fukomys damarensis]|uniref:laminin subunit alpha-1 isoform X1 n=2 Tax=Fukomys damarensis TaxID=885580 RepID=UPI00053FC1F0|nr:laminin subunit alpha-1 isoform X1 [Fukomys damarensis]